MPDVVIFVVDDNPMNGNLLAKQLEKFGVTVMRFTSGEDAVNEYKKMREAGKAPPTFILDKEMKQNMWTGPATAEAIREYEGEKGLSAAEIYRWTTTTPRENPEVSVYRDKSGHILDNGYLFKPPKPPEIKALVEAIQRNQLQDHYPLSPRKPPIR